MKYMGSKSRHAKEIINIILYDCMKNSNIKYTTWIEPFVGGANVIDKLGNLFATGGSK